MEEIWEQVDGWEGLYEVSNLGKVKSVRNNILLRIHDNGHGYFHLELSNKGSKKRYYIHRLVARAFLPNPDNKKEVNHIDNNPLNNTVSNLEWCTPKENIQHSTKQGRGAIKCGEINGNSKLLEKEVVEIRNSQLRQFELARKYKVSKRLISKIINRDTWKHI